MKRSQPRGMRPRINVHLTRATWPRVACSSKLKSVCRHEKEDAATVLHQDSMVMSYTIIADVILMTPEIFLCA